MKFAVWCHDPISKDGCGSGLAHMLVQLLLDEGKSAYVLSSLKPHPFAVHVMLELDLDIRELEVFDEPEAGDVVLSIGASSPWEGRLSDVPNPLEHFDDSYNDERVHYFRRAREALRGLAAELV